MDTHETIVISVGGSLIVPDQIDTDFLTNLKSLVLEETANGRHFIIICGGGKTARRYQDAARAVGMLDAEDLDWLGIHGTRINAHLLRTILKDVAHPVIYHRLDDGIANVEEPVVIGAGCKPGSSSDYIAVKYAAETGAKRLINLSNIDHVYTDDPKTNPDAEKIEDIAWSDFRKLIPEEWDPGLSSPFDPVAAREAEGLGLEVAIINGTKLDELKKYLHGEAFTGTQIHI